MSERLGTRFASAADSPGLSLWHVTHRWQAAMRATLAPHGLTHVQYVLLASLVWLRSGETEVTVTQAELADWAGTDVMMTSQVLRALEAKGFVDRMPHPHDRRARLLRPTDAGVRAAQRATRDVEAADAAFFAPLRHAGAFAEELARLASSPGIRPPRADVPRSTTGPA